MLPAQDVGHDARDRLYHRLSMRVVVVGLLMVLVACSGGTKGAADARPQDAPQADAGDDAAPPVDASATITTDHDTATTGDAVLVTATLVDASNQPIAGVAVTFAASGAGNQLSTPPLTDASGSTTVTWTSSVAESKTITASVGNNVVAMHTVMFLPGPGVNLAFIVQPSTAVAGAPITPSMQVGVVDSFGNVVPTATGSVTLVLAANPGNTRVQAFAPIISGIATLSNVHVDVAATGYTLRASSTGLPAVTSAPFDIVPGAPDQAHSSITISPPSLDADGISAAQVQTRIANPYGIGISGVAVSLAVTGSNNVLLPSAGMTDATGVMTASLTSTTAEVKTVTATIASFMLNANVHFYAIGCSPRLPGAPWKLVDNGGGALFPDDVDGDGHIDALFTNYTTRSVAVYRGHGDLTFTKTTTVAFTQPIRTLAIGDLDNDGHRDLVVSLENTSTLAIARGLGGGMFAVPTTIAIPSEAFVIRVADVNRDGKQDLVLNVSNSHEVVVEKGDGAGGFMLGAALTNIDEHDVLVVDVNADSKLDIVTCGGSAIRTFLGDGAGNFSFVGGFTVSGAETLYAGDFNGDGKLDLAAASAGQLTAVIGNGSGGFSTGSAAATANASSGQPYEPQGGGVRDVDGDGKLDVVLGEGNLISVMHNAGNGTFSLAHAYAAGASGLVDVDEDGIPDLLSAWSGIFGVARGLAGGQFEAPMFAPRGNGTSFASGGDLNHDGRVDLVREGTLGDVCELTQADGSPSSAAAFSSSYQAYDLIVEDWSGDAKPDIVGLYSGSLTYWVGNGDGTMQPPASQAVDAGFSDLAAANLDGNARADLVLTKLSAPGFWLSVAQPNNTFGPPQAVTSGATWVAVKDVSGDGISDVLTADGNGDLAVYKGNGSGGVLPPASYPALGMLGAVALADANNDGVDDVVMLHEDSLHDVVSVAVMVGRGGGAFQAPYVTPNLRVPSDLVASAFRAADLTGDGITDIGIATSYGFVVLRGYGDGYFSQAPMYYPFAGFDGSAGHSSLVIADRNGDNRNDAAFWATSGIGVALYNGCR